MRLFVVQMPANAKHVGDIIWPMFLGDNHHDVSIRTLTALLTATLFLSLGACDNSSEPEPPAVNDNTVNDDAGSDDSVTEDTATDDTTQPATITTPATEKLLSEGFNQPQASPAQWAVFSLDTEQSMQDNYYETMDLIRDTFGGYMNWNYMVLNHEGSDDVNLPSWSDSSSSNTTAGKEATLPRSWFKSQAVSAVPTPTAWNGMRIMKRTQPAWRGRPFSSNPMASSTRIIAPSPGSSPSKPSRRACNMNISITISGRTHWTEASTISTTERTPTIPSTLPGGGSRVRRWLPKCGGCATAGQSSRICKMSLRVGAYIDGRLAEDKKSFWFALQRIQKSPPYTEPNGFINADMNDCSGWMLSAEHSDGYPGGDEDIECEWDLAPFAPIRFMAHTSSWRAVMRDIPADYFALGFWGAVERHTGLNEAAFYDAFNAFMRATNWEDIDPEFAPSGWNTPEESIESVVDFLGIQPYTGE